MKNLLVSVAVLVCVSFVPVAPVASPWQSDTPCSDALNAAFEAAATTLYLVFADKRIEIAEDFREGNEKCERDHSTQEDIAACKTLVRARARGRFRDAVNTYKADIAQACNNYDPYACRHTETPKYGRTYRNICQFGRIPGLPARNPY